MLDEDEDDGDLMSRLDYSKRLFGDGMRRAVYSESVGVTSNLGQSSQTQLRYGTVTKGTWEDELSGKKYVEILLDGSDDPVTLTCDSTLKTGDRVSVLITGTNAMVVPLTDRILEDAQANTEVYFGKEGDKIVGRVESMIYDEDGNPIYASSTEISETASEIRKEFDTYYYNVDGELTKLDSYIRESADGIEVGKESGKYRALVNSSGSFDILDSSRETVVSMTASLGMARIISPDFSTVALVSNGGSSVSCESSNVKLATNGGKIIKSCGYTETDSFDSSTNLGSTNVPGCILLYSGSTTSSVSLKVSSTYLAMLTIVYSDGSRQMSQTVYSPSGKSVALFRSVNSGSTTYLQSEIVTISGSTISRGLCGQVDIKNGSYPSVDDTVRFTIKYVIGWTG